MKDQEMVDMKERMAKLEEGLRQKEEELAAIRAAEEEEEAKNALRVEQLQSRVRELEDAIQERDETAVDGMDTSEVDAAEKEHELASLKTTLDACQKELSEHMTRADSAEVRDGLVLSF